MQSDGCRSCNENIKLEINNSYISFPNISSVEEIIENLFLSSCFKFSYQTENFRIENIESNFIIDIFDNDRIFIKDKKELIEFENKLCGLLKNVIC